MERKRYGLLALTAVAGATAVCSTAWWMGQRGVVVGPAPAPRPMTAAPATPAPAAPGPSFDIARIGPNGGAVVAGRAAPGAEVVLRGGTRELGRARANARGEWLILPDEPLPPGSHALTLHAREADGTERAGTDSVLVLVPRSVAETPTALLLPDPATAAAPRLLQTVAAPAGTAGSERLGLDIVDYDVEGAIRFAGTAPGGSTVRLYIDRAHAGDARADAGGRWTLQPSASPAPGLHSLRLDQIGPRGEVIARLELPFERDADAGLLAEGRVVVQPGHSLWRIARNTYGRGTRYTVIYAANREQIRDPSRIYPGQVFNLPSP